MEIWEKWLINHISSLMYFIYKHWMIKVYMSLKKSRRNINAKYLIYKQKNTAVMLSVPP